MYQMVVVETYRSSRRAPKKLGRLVELYSMGWNMSCLFILSMGLILAWSSSELTTPTESGPFSMPISDSTQPRSFRGV